MRPAASNAAWVCISDSLLALTAVVRPCVSPTMPTPSTRMAHNTSISEKPRVPTGGVGRDGFHSVPLFWLWHAGRQEPESDAVERVPTSSDAPRLILWH